jgi:biopolymer transport protein ExbD
MEIKKKSNVNVAIPTASMPDIIFMLLIFFMVATVIKQFSGLKVDLPDAVKIQKIEGSKRHVVSVWIDKEDNVVCDDVTIKEITDLRNIVYNKLVINPQIQIALKGDREAKMEFIDKVHQELRKASALKVHYFATPGGDF